MKRIIQVVSFILVFSLWTASAAQVQYKTRKLFQSIGLEGPAAVISMDLDGDGDADLLTASKTDSVVRWHRNDGGLRFIGYNLPDVPQGPVAVAAADLNDDDSIDLLSASNVAGVFSLYTNDGNMEFTYQALTSAPGACDIAVADFNNDDLPDICAASAGDNSIHLFQNNGGFSFTHTVLSSSATGAAAVLPYDLDGDGDIDILAACAGSNSVLFFVNDGSGQFASAQTLSADLPGVRSLAAADFDGDGDRDIACAAAGENRLVWLENDGAQVFSRNTIQFSQAGISRVRLADINNDGIMDLITSCEDSHSVAWFESGGDGAFSPHTISRAVGGATDVFAVDLDDDGDVDMLSSAFDEERIYFHESRWSEPASMDFESDLVGYFPLDGNARDLSPAQRHGTVVGAAKIIDRFGAANKAYDFDGSGDYIRWSDSDVWDFESDFTLSLWYYQFDGEGTIFSNADGASGYKLYMENGYLIFESGGTRLSSSATLRTEEWINITVRLYGYEAGIYLNGNLHIQGDVALPLANDVGESAAATHQPDSFFRGHLDDIRIYQNRAMNDNEIMALYEEEEIRADFYAWRIGGTVPLTIEFINNSSGSNISYSWDFGDGQTSTERNPTHVYTYRGMYTVTLTVESMGKHDTAVFENYVICMPAGEPVLPDTLYEDSFEQLSDDAWTFRHFAHWSLDEEEDFVYINDSDYPAAPNEGLGEYALLNHSFDGNYALEVNVRMPEDIYLNTTADYCLVFGYQNENQYYYALFSSKKNWAAVYQVSEAGRQKIQGRWGAWIDDNDWHKVRVTTLDQQVWVMFDDQPVFYCGRLETDGKIGFGSLDDAPAFDNVRVTWTEPPPAPPVAEFATQSTHGEVPFEVQFTDLSSGEISSWYWEFGDGYASQQQHPLHTYETADTFTVSLTVTGPGGSDTRIRENYIVTQMPVDVPVARFGAQTTWGVAPFTVQFVDSSSGEITQWAWEFGDGSGSSEQHPQHTYAEPDTYSVSLTVIGPKGTDHAIRRKYIIVTPNTAVDSEGDRPVDYRLYANTPNPFNPLTRIQYDVKAAGPVTLAVYDVRGRKVAMLLDEMQAAGSHTAVFDAAGLPSGIYILRYTAGSFTDTRKMVLSR